MVATMKKSVSFTMLIALLMTVLFSFASPFVAHAEESNGEIPEVKVNADGTLEISKGNFNQSGDQSAWTTLLSKYRHFIVGISGVGAITMVVIFIFQFLKLGASATNPQARSQALVGVLWSGIAAAGLGSVSLIVGLFYHAIT